MIWEASEVTKAAFYELFSELTVIDVCIVLKCSKKK